MSHPAKFSPEILDVIFDVLDDLNFTGSILDPFAGVGGVHALQNRQKGRVTAGIELEPEWSGGADNPFTVTGDCRDVMKEWAAYHYRFDAIVTSPTYGNRFADRDMRESCAGTYMKGLGREATAGSSCHIHWGHAYREFHNEVWGKAVNLLPVGGLFILNIKDHIRDGKRQRVAGWHVRNLIAWELTCVDIIPVPTPGLRRGTNHGERCTELVVVMVKDH